MEKHSKNRNKVVSCIICDKTVRSDVLKRHMRTHERKISPVCMSSADEVVEEMEQNKENFEQNIALGRRIVKRLSEGGIPEASLSKRHKYSLELYRRNRTSLIVDDVKLRNWQQDLMTRIDRPSLREIIWVVGACGNEGKTWFQNYLESFYDYEKVACLDLDGRSQDILHALSKRPLELTDIFLFNISRDCHDRESSYRVLEMIKDGRALTTKYNSNVLRFKTQNVVMVFANAPPDPTRLSRDRWSVLQITGKETELKIVELNSIKKNKHGDVNIDVKGYVNEELSDKWYETTKKSYERT